MMFLWFLFLIPLVIYVFSSPGEALRGGLMCRATTPPPHTAAPGHEDPVAILRRRLARGEITPPEFESMRRTLGA